MYTLERKKLILRILEQHGSVNSIELSRELNVSRETIRRDISALAKDGLLIRTHGGALPVSASVPVSAGPDAAPDLPPASSLDAAPASELAPLLNIGTPAYYHTPGSSASSFACRYPRSLEAKRKLAKTAASFIEDKDTIFLDNSTTTLLLLDYLPKTLQLTIITNSVQVLAKTASLQLPLVSLICLSGFYNPDNYSLYGTRTIMSMEGFYPDKTFVSCTGISLTRQLTDICLDEVDTKKAIISKSRTTFLMADHTKFGLDGPFLFTTFDQIDYIITDKYRHSPDNLALIETLQSQYNIQVVTGDAE